MNGDGICCCELLLVVNVVELFVELCSIIAGSCVVAVLVVYKNEPRVYVVVAVSVSVSFLIIDDVIVFVKGSIVVVCMVGATKLVVLDGDVVVEVKVILPSLWLIDVVLLVAKIVPSGRVVIVSPVV